MQRADGKTKNCKLQAQTLVRERHQHSAAIRSRLAFMHYLCERDPKICVAWCNDAIVPLCVLLLLLCLQTPCTTSKCNFRSRGLFIIQFFSCFSVLFCVPSSHVEAWCLHNIFSHLLHTKALCTSELCVLSSFIIV